MKTSEIITKLKDNYCKIKKNKDQYLVINNEWQSINDEKLKIVVVGDNPGKKEKEDSKYFHPKGTAGSKARDFLARYFEDDEILFINKCPFFSPTTKDLMITPENEDYINCSIKSSVKAIKKLIAINEIKVLITGCAYNKLNLRFYRILFKHIENWDQQENLFFSKHFSRNHFNSQYIKTQSKGNNKIETILSEINKETKEILKNNFKSCLKYKHLSDTL